MSTNERQDAEATVRRVQALRDRWAEREGWERFAAYVLDHALHGGPPATCAPHAEHDCLESVGFTHERGNFCKVCDRYILNAEIG